MERGFEVPLVPWLPAIGALTSLVLLANVQLVSLVLGLGVETIGLVIWHVHISELEQTLRHLLAKM